MKISSKKTLIIADVHQKLSYPKKILGVENDNDCLIFLGDLFDDFEPQNSIEEIIDFIIDVKPLVCIGNHDIHYFGSNLYKSHYRCTGYQAITHKIIQDRRELKKFFIPFVIINETWLVSHAGIHPFHWEGYQKTWERAQTGLDNPDIFCDIYGAGQDRGGRQRVGGLTWLDSINFENIKEYKQIFGHTIQKKPKKIGNSFCIDCDQKVYAVLEDNKIELKWLQEQ